MSHQAFEVHAIGLYAYGETVACELRVTREGYTGQKEGHGLTANSELASRKRGRHRHVIIVTWRVARFASVHASPTGAAMTMPVSDPSTLR